MKTLKDRIVNLENCDYHMHSSNFSDGIPTVNEIVQFAWTIWMKEIAITDHSQISIDKFRKKNNIYAWNTARYSLRNWANVYNDVSVIFWVEGDLLNEKWDVCFDIQWKESDFIILSAHSWIYEWDPETVTKWTINAIKKYHNKIKFIWHPCSFADFWEYYDIKELVEVANEYSVWLEFNAKVLERGKSNLEKLDYMLNNTNKIYINSDAHTLYDFKNVRKKAIDFLYDKWYLIK